ncbi:coiled-coil domain-containing protein, partial [Thiolapillus sp.]|uniref:coiled-coil domain-containing protein n=1 Tax=Thiolapillus sp. TaxID=2017437 RepID=UPI003AF8FAB2
MCEKNGWFAEEILNWLGGNVKHGLQCSADGPCVLISQKAMAITTTGDIGITPGYVGPPSSLFLMLCGDIESNPGPSTDELIMELGRSLGTRLDNLSTDLQSLRTTITSMSCQISELTKQLQKKEEDIEDVKSRTKGLEGRLEKMEEEVERQQIINRQDNIVFFGIPEKEGRESEDDCVSIM